MKRLNLQVVVLILFWMPVILLVSWRIYTHSYQKADKKFPNSIEGYVMNHPYQKDGLQEFKLYGYRIKTNLYPEIQFRDYVNITGYKINEYDIIYFPKIRIVQKGQVNTFAILNTCRRYVIRQVQRNMPEPQASLLLGMMIGYKEDYPDKTVNLLKRTGVMHVVVVSGYNISLVLGLVFIFFRRLSKTIMFVSSTILVILYMLIVGLDPPVIRAVVMGIISLYALITGSQQLAIYTLFMSGIFMILVNPAYLSDISFQMSFIATLSIIAYSALHIKRSAIVAALMIVVFVNLALVPIFLYYFGTYSVLGIIVNLLVLWVVPFLTIGGFLFVFSSNVVLKVILMILSSYFFFVVNLFGGLNIWFIEYRMSKFGVFTYYLGILVIYKLILFIIEKNNAD